MSTVEWISMVIRKLCGAQCVRDQLTAAAMPAAARSDVRGRWLGRRELAEAVVDRDLQALAAVKLLLRTSGVFR